MNSALRGSKILQYEERIEKTSVIKGKILVGKQLSQPATDEKTWCKYKRMSDNNIYNQLLFWACRYLEDNTFSTGHQSVNVYGLPEKCYEIRSEDTAVDVQIHRPVATATHHPHVIVQSKAITPPAVQTVEFYWLNEKTRVCPFDRSLMSVTPVPVYKTDGRSKKLNMLVCPSCQKKYMTKSGIPESIHLEEYCVSANPLPDKANSASQTSASPASPRYRAYKPGDVLKGKKIMIAISGGETVQGIVKDDTGSMISFANQQ